jgi:hypothetical protein
LTSHPRALQTDINFIVTAINLKEDNNTFLDEAIIMLFPAIIVALWALVVSANPIHYKREVGGVSPLESSELKV